MASTKDELSAILEDNGLSSRKSMKVGDNPTRAIEKDAMRVSDKSVLNERKSRRSILDVLDGNKLPTVQMIDENSHAFWASTSEGAQPSIANLLRGGAEFVHISEVSTDLGNFVRAEANQDKITVQEMVLMKLPTEDVMAYYDEKHHRAPARMQKDLFSNFLNKGRRDNYSLETNGLDMSELEDDDISFKVAIGNAMGNSAKIEYVDLPDNWDNMRKLPEVKKEKRKSRKVSIL